MSEEFIDLREAEKSTWSNSKIAEDEDRRIVKAMSEYTDGDIVEYDFGGESGKFVVKSGTSYDDGSHIIVFTDDSCRYDDMSHSAMLPKSIKQRRITHHLCRNPNDKQARKIWEKLESRRVSVMVWR